MAQPSACLLGLPGELRAIIYDYICILDPEIRPLDSAGHVIRPWEALLLTRRHISHELRVHMSASIYLSNK